MTTAQAFKTALAHHQSGQLLEAEAIYRQILAVQPQHADALHLLGVLASQVGHPEAAVELISQAIAQKPNDSSYYSNLGEAYRSLGRSNEAMQCYRRALAINPDFAEAHNNLGLTLNSEGQVEEAISCYRRALALKPGYAEAYNNLGGALGSQGASGEAITWFRKALEIQPEYAEAYNNLGVALEEQGQPDEAILCFQKALEIKPDFAEVCNNLGNAFFRKGQWNDAITYYKQAQVLRPDFFSIHMDIGNAFYHLGQLDEAIQSYQCAIETSPECAEAYNNLGCALKDEGQLVAAIECYRRAVALAPNELSFHCNLLYYLHCLSTSTSRTLYAEHRQWDRQHGQPRRKFIRPHSNNIHFNRPLKIGYVSPDLREHPVGRFILPLLEQHDHKCFEITCYAGASCRDNLTARLHACADHWHETYGWSEEQLTEQIRQDKIDVLVDLSLHLSGNRLTVFAHKPAPVQVTWLAYASTSGLDAMDFRLTDPYLDPMETSDAYSETSICLPDTYWCYQASEKAPKSVSPLPMLSAGHVTFGCLNNFSKVNEPVLRTWARLMREVTASCLLLHTHEGSHRKSVRATLSQEGISPERVIFIGFMPPSDYYKQYERIDIALDPFPYVGGTTTCDALWMGVPVVSLVGQTAVGRGGLSILSNIGLPELAARTEDEYVKIAVDLANDLPRLAQLRATMRERMLASPLMDAPRFARSIEDAYRTMWTKWCEGREKGNSSQS